MHEVACKASGKIQGARNAVKDTRFRDPSIETTLTVFGLVLGSGNAVQVLSILCRIYVREGGNVDIRVRGRLVVFEAQRLKESWVVVSTLSFVATDKSAE